LLIAKSPLAERMGFYLHGGYVEAPRSWVVWILVLASILGIGWRWAFRNGL